jgi:hypothetical protein
MDVTILLLWIVVLLILHLLVEKSLQMKTIAEAFMNTDKMKTRTTLEQDINALPSCDKPMKEQALEEDNMESDLLNFLMNGDPALSKQMEDDEEGETTFPVPTSGEFNLANHTNILNDTVSKSDERYQLNSGKFANLNTFDSIAAEGSEQYSSPM